MSDLLKEAIADARTLRGTALENARIALKDAFDPKLKAMLSAKLREDEDEMDYDEEELEEPVDSEEFEEQDEVEPEDLEEPEEEEEFEVNVDEQDEEEFEEPEEEEEEFEEQDEPEEDEEDELDIESVIKELEAELDEEEDLEEPEEEEEDDETFEVDESLFEEDDDEEYDDEEEYEDEDEDEESEANLESLRSELQDHKEGVRYLQKRLHEINVLNAKLLFTNKLFREFALDRNQKLRVVETFDRAQTAREIKLAYTTLAEGFQDTPVTQRSKLKESASTKVDSTRPSGKTRKVITEESKVADRFRFLANIKK